MLTVFILTTQVAYGFLMFEAVSEAACHAARDRLNAIVANSAECYEIKMPAPGGSLYAPEKSPLPVPKPVRGQPV